MPKSDNKSSIASEKTATVLMMLAPLAILFLVFELRLGGLKHGMRHGNDTSYFVPMPIANFDPEDEPFELDQMDED